MTELLIKIASGALIGYLTNYAAIKMLFKKYLGLGGVVLKTREEFIRNISTLIEKEIIKDEAIKKHLKDQSFKKVLDLFIEDFIHNLIQAHQNQNLEDISGLIETVDKSIIDVAPLLAGSFKKLILDPGIVEVLLSSDQIENISKNLQQTLSKSISKQKINEVLESLVDHFNQYYPTSLQAVLKEKLEIIAPLIQSFPERIIKEFGQAAEGEDQLRVLLSEIINNDLIINPVLDLLLDNLQELITSEKGHQIMRSFITIVLKLLEHEKESIADYLSPETNTELRQYIKNNLPDVLSLFMTWLKEEQAHLEQIIDTTFKANIDSRFKAWLVKTFVGSIGKKLNISERVIQYFQQHSPEELGEKTTKLLLEYLQDQSIGQLVQYFSKNADLNKVSKVLQELMLKFIKDNRQKIVSFVKANINAYSEVMMDHLNTFLQKKGTQEQIGKYLYQNLYDLADHDFSASGITLFSNGIRTYLQSPDFEKYLQKNLNNIKRDIPHFESPDFFEHALAAYWEKYRKYKITNFSIPSSVHVALSSLSHELILTHTNTLLENKLSVLVRDNLSKLPPAQLRDMVEKFMGTEIKPITAFGALLGGIAGGALHYTSVSENKNIAFAFNTLAYGVTGWATNWLAVKMIFRPYKKYPYIPFTPGVIAKNKPKFAQNMGKFVSTHLLDTALIHQQFADRKESLLNQLQSYLSEHEYQRIDQFKEAYSEQGFIHLTQKLIQKLRDPHDPLYETWISILGNTSLEDLLPAWEKRTSILRERIRTQLPEYEHLHLGDFIKEPVWKKLISSIDFKGVFQKISSSEKKLGNLFFIPEWKEGIVQYVFTQLSDLEEGKISEIIKNEKISILKLLHQGWDQFLPQLVQFIIKMATTWLGNNKLQLAEDIYKEAKKQNKGALMYKKSIKETVLSLSEKQIPEFLNSRKESFEDNLRKIINQLSDKEITIKLNSKQIKNKIDVLSQRDTVKETFKSIVEITLEHSWYTLSLKNLVQSIEVYHNQEATSILKANVSEKTLKKYENTLYSSLHQHFGGIPIKKLLGQPYPDFQESVMRFADYFLKQNQTRSFFEGIYGEMATFRLKDGVDMEILKRDLFQSLVLISEKEHLRKEISNSMESIFNSIYQNIPKTLKTHIVQQLSSNFVRTFDHHLPSLLAAVPVHQIVVQEVTQMHPRQIENVFNSFAKIYFDRLISYGFVLGTGIGAGSELVSTLLER